MQKISSIYPFIHQIKQISQSDYLIVTVTFGFSEFVSALKKIISFCQFILEIQHILKSHDLKGYIIFDHTHQGFPNGVDLWGTIWTIWPKTAWKLKNQHFRGKTLGRTWGDEPTFCIVGGIPPVPPPRGNPAHQKSIKGHLAFLNYLHQLNLFFRS